MSDIPRLRGVIRVGPFREASKQFKPVLRLGVAKDGGVFIEPAAVQDFGWWYGPLIPDEINSPATREHVEVKVRPKLHYHRSGMVFVTLTGHDLERRSVRFPEIPTLVRAQIFSVVSVRTWELATRGKEPGRGDVFWMVKRWPDAFTMTLSLVRLPPDRPHRVVMDALAPLGLLDRDPDRFVLDLSGHGLAALLVATIAASYDPRDDLEPGTSVIAVPWTPRGESVREAFGLWTTSVRNPIVKFEDDKDLPDTEYFIA